MVLYIVNLLNVKKWTYNQLGRMKTQLTISLASCIILFERKAEKINKTTNKKSEDKKLSDTYIFYHYYPSLEVCSFHNKSIISGLHLGHMQDLKP